jgi:hypothetical protein
MPATHDVFLSYARSDQDIELDVERLALTISHEFLRVGGREGRVFIDKSIRFGEDWPDTIQNALESSRVMLACASPAYFQSSWCRREWEFFDTRERTTGTTLIFPVRLRPWDRVLDPSADTRAWMAGVGTRQMPEVSALLGENSTEIRRLVDAMLDAMGPARDGHAPSGAGARVAVRLGTNQAEFENCLARASRVTVVGVTHQNLIEVLRRALERRAQEHHEPWSELRIVFLDKQLLGFVFDERSEKDMPGVIAQERARMADNVQRKLRRFLEHRLGMLRWSMHEYPYILPFVGAFFELPDGQKVAQVASLPPGRPGGADALYLEFNSFVLPGETAHFEYSFAKIIAISQICDEMVLVGRPQGDGFLVRGCRARAETLTGKLMGQGESTAAIIALLWQRGPDGAAQPLLRVRTSENSGRELGQLSNLSGYVNVHDAGRSDPGTREEILSEMAQQRAVNREIGEELNLRERCWSDPVPVGSARYHFADALRESFMFFLYSVELNCGVEDLPIPAGARLTRWSLADLVELRRQQVLRLTADALSATLSPEQLRQAVMVAGLNLRLHDEDALAHDLDEALASQTRRTALVERLQERLREARRKAPFVYTIGNKDHFILGLAALQYREFFSKLIPAYAARHVGVPGAAAVASRTKELAAGLSSLYQDREFVRTVPIGLDDLHGAAIH